MRVDKTMENVTGAIALVDLEPKIAAVNRAYLDWAVIGDMHNARINDVSHARNDGRLYLIYADRFVFWSDDGFATLHDLREINYEGKSLVGADVQSIDAIVETMRGTIVLVGRDKRDGQAAGITWRKERYAEAFVRHVATRQAWRTSKAGNATAGYFGSPPRDMLAVGIYAEGAHLYFSLDDGITWSLQDLSNAFAQHVHQVYLPHSVHPRRMARMWVTGGDDPSGTRSGVVCFDALGSDGLLTGFRYVLRERPGFRLVGLTGNGKHIYIGNESLAGGMLKLQDNAESIEAQDFEYILGKNRHDYFIFRAIVATLDGLLIAGSNSYGRVGDTTRADSGGYLYASTDDGASFREISLGAKWITSIAYDGEAFWVATSMGGDESAVDISSRRLTLLRLAKPGSLAELTDAYCAKVVICDSSDFYREAGYASHPRAELQPDEVTFRVDMSRYLRLSLLADNYEAGELAVESLPFSDWRPDANRWVSAMIVKLDAPGRHQFPIPEAATISRYFRVRNIGSRPIALRQLAFLGKR
jgi:hypothetical protein